MPRRKCFRLAKILEQSNLGQFNVELVLLTPTRQRRELSLPIDNARDASRANRRVLHFRPDQLVALDAKGPHRVVNVTALVSRHNVYEAELRATGNDVRLKKFVFKGVVVDF